MGRLRRTRLLFLSLLSAACLGCGGGGGGSSPSNVQSPPAPSPDFTITLSSSSVSIAQGATAAPITISVAGQNGFTAAVQITLAGLPSGVASNPTNPLMIASGANTAIVLGASPNAVTGNFTVTAQGLSGSLSHSATLALTVQPSSAALLPRTTYLRTDAVAAFDDPPGEPHHRHIAYDAANKHLFVANRAMNRVEVISTADLARVARISIPGASSVDVSFDGATVWVGTITNHAVAIDTATLRVRSRYAVQPLSPIPNAVFDRPEDLLPMSGGKIMMRLRQSSAAQSLLALWDPVANALTNLTPVAPEYFKMGLAAWPAPATTPNSSLPQMIPAAS
jgi:hypothetical protein